MERKRAQAILRIIKRAIAVRENTVIIESESAINSIAISNDEQLVTLAVSVVSKAKNNRKKLVVTVPILLWADRTISVSADRFSNKKNRRDFWHQFILCIPPTAVLGSYVNSSDPTKRLMETGSLQHLGLFRVELTLQLGKLRYGVSKTQKFVRLKDLFTGEELKRLWTEPIE